ncbi:MAG TPA: hypothetical protein VFK13_07920 [Gemmatimonadaceae bacterium]|nr:hypothetical protein [Gemmatimonadaceae bacterium]
MRFVVTGTGRSGTGYAAKLFNAAGLRCGHEDVFTDKPGLWDSAAPRQGLVARAKEPLGRAKEELRRRRTHFEGDASWMAVPRLARFKGVSFLQLRHPIPVIRSFMGTKFFSNPLEHRAQRRFASAHFEITGDDIRDAMRWWTFWNGLAAAHATMVYRLEDMGEPLFTEILRKLGVETPADRARVALSTVAGGVNSSRERGITPGAITFEDLPDGEDKAELFRAAVAWGYDPEDS